MEIHHSAVNRVRHELQDEPGFEVFDEPRWTPPLSALDDLDARCTELDRRARQLVHDVAMIVRENRRLREVVGKR